jgi:hypothetical protein
MSVLDAIVFLGVSWPEVATRPVEIADPSRGSSAS